MPNLGEEEHPWGSAHQNCSIAEKTTCSGSEARAGFARGLHHVQSPARTQETGSYEGDAEMDRLLRLALNEDVLHRRT